MARYVLTPFPAYGHVIPMAAVATELVERGEEVIVVINPEWSERFRELDCEIVDIGVARRSSVAQSPARTLPERIRRARMVAQERKRLAVPLGERLREWRPDTVVVDVMAGWGLRAAEAAGTPLTLLHTTYALSEKVLIDEVAKRSGPRTAAVIGATRIARIQPGINHRAAGYAALALVNAVPELQPARETFDDRYHFVGPLRKPELPGEGDGLPWDRIRSDVPTLYVSTGTMFTRDAEFFRRVALAFADSGWLVILSTSNTDPADVGEMPSNVIVRRYVPQAALLPHCDVFLTHAGMNSAQESLAAALPMVCVPANEEQRQISRRIAEMNAGVMVPVDAPGADFRAAVEKLASDASVRVALDDIAQRMARTDGPALAADRIQQLVAGGRP